MPPFAVAKCMVSGLALIAAALIPLGCEQSPGPAAAPPSETQRQPPRPVRLVPAAEEVVDRRVSATGTLAADEQVVLGTKVAGAKAGKAGQSRGNAGHDWERFGTIRHVWRTPRRRKNRPKRPR